MTGLWFIDFEASSLSQNSYPIEVGIAYLDLETRAIMSDGFLITPEKSWNDWDPVSEKIHGIPRSDLAKGLAASEVCTNLNDRLEGERVHCDAPAFDGRWNAVLFADYEEGARYKIDSVWTPLMNHVADDDAASFALVSNWQTLVRQIFREPNPHRAEADARLLASCYVRAIDLWSELSQK